ncbi:putative ABC transporter substrate-binding protein [Caenibius tardaugens NBRC 16725]|uniref:Putative ABC transporter substrate-binding protein n=1 Tax=Caenibius tardaugens NBRC 16725 TaxID=1219035 RepID=U2ZUQ8_9SPHN|nr:ABC transporter substrate-binding protein [Caenibius tardaugens]AZI36485.1 peptide ABC transporter substrate-binding protein [Caenibius tardaugens NBRC 16725]GAD49119.1 putative ABC transporter substrate-binding protein [Caenibius tardaugens NBRC 16725]
MARRFFRFPLALALVTLASACNWVGDKGTLDMIVIGSPEEMFDKGPILSPAGQQLRSAIVDGLVGFDGTGQVAPGLADRWIVTDDGTSYIFRMRDGVWPDGSELTGESVRDALRRTLRELRGTPLGFDLARISDVRAMAGRVVEIRLSSPMPDLLQLLAQPELGLVRNGKGSGLLRLEREGDIARLIPVPPEKRGLPAIEHWGDDVRRLELRAFPARKAIALFDEGEVDVVLGGRIEFLPLADTGPLSRGTVRLDRVSGLFGLLIRSDEGFLSVPSLREALAMAIDREKLIVPFNVSGWQATTRVVAPGMPGDLGTTGERWASLSQEQRRVEAAIRVGSWRSAHGGTPVVLTVAMPEGPGADILFTGMQADLAAIGVSLVRTKATAQADMVMIDREARYANASWFLNQFNCTLRTGLCSPEADARVRESLTAPDTASAAALLAEAEAELTAANVYIPLGAPLRWSLVRGTVKGFEPNIWGVHPLSALALVPR